MSGRQPSNYDPRATTGNSGNRQGQRSSNHSSGNRQGQGSSNSGNRQSQGSSNSGRTSQGYSMDRYLNTRERHETWDWEKKAQNRNDKNTRL